MGCWSWASLPGTSDHHSRGPATILVAIRFIQTRDTCGQHVASWYMTCSTLVLSVQSILYKTNFKAVKTYVIPSFEREPRNASRVNFSRPRDCEAHWSQLELFLQLNTI